jgi:hypothetical protein
VYFVRVFVCRELAQSEDVQG